MTRQNHMMELFHPARSLHSRDDNAPSIIRRSAAGAKPANDAVIVQSIIRRSAAGAKPANDAVTVRSIIRHSAGGATPAK
ncbi:MAG: hypothetical protein AB7F35_08955 [Acetobacteraceae bacterium]